ncbi:MAG: polysaccharide biosynthesis C-terminal domain-containing protein, partial [bacterium]|nr:polysaccharide biosynthesis C-terminal domain-containing protein [bacterium]
WIAISRPEYGSAAPVLQWLIVYSLCRPILDDVHALLYGVGAPKSVAGFTCIQAILLLILAPLLTQKMGIRGTALSMNITAGIGLILALWIARRYVEVPLFKTFFPPLISAAVGLGVRLAADSWITSLSSFSGFFFGGFLFTLGYGITLLALERNVIMNECKTVWQAIRAKQSNPSEVSQ